MIDSFPWPVSFSFSAISHLTSQTCQTGNFADYYPPWSWSRLRPSLMTHWPAEASSCWAAFVRIKTLLAGKENCDNVTVVTSINIFNFSLSVKHNADWSLFQQPQNGNYQCVNVCNASVPHSMVTEKGEGLSVSTQVSRFLHCWPKLKLIINRDYCRFIWPGRYCIFQLKTEARCSLVFCPVWNGLPVTRVINKSISYTFTF